MCIENWDYWRISSLNTKPHAFGVWVCMSFTSLTYSPEGTSRINSKVICLLTSPLFADRIHSKVKYKQVDKACYKKINLIWVNEILFNRSFGVDL